MKKVKFLGSFLIKQLYRFQYGYQKLAGILGISNAISLLLLMLKSFEIEIPTYVLIIVYVGIFIFSIIFVYTLERLGSIQSERRLDFKMKNSEMYRLQTTYNALLIAQNMLKTKEELSSEIQAIELELFDNKKNEP